MSTNTSHYNLVKQDTSEHWSVDILNSNLDKIDAALWKLPQIRRTLAATDDLNSLTESTNGMFSVLYIGSATPVNAPTGMTWALLYQIVVNNTNMIHQLIVKPVTAEVWMREYSGNPASWTEWKCISRNAPNTLSFTRNTTNASSGNGYGAKSGNMVQINGWFVLTSTGNASGKVIFSGLPRPFKNVAVMCYDETADSGYMVYIEPGETDLKVSLPESSRTGHTINFSACYLTY